MVIHKGDRARDSWSWKAPRNVWVAATMKGYITKAKFHECGLHFVAYLKRNGLLNKNEIVSLDLLPHFYWVFLSSDSRSECQHLHRGCQPPQSLYPILSQFLSPQDVSVLSFFVGTVLELLFVAVELPSAPSTVTVTDI